MIIIAASAIIICGVLWAWMHERAKKQEAVFQLRFFQEQNQRIPVLEEDLKGKDKQLQEIQLKHHVAEEKLALLAQAQEQLKNTFSALSSEALEKNNRQFLDLAKSSLEKVHEMAKGDLEKKHQAIGEMLAPVKESLNKLDTGMRQLEKERKGEQESLKEQVRSLIETEKQLRQETSSLVKALRTPLARGRWGEIQLRRVVEMAGMLNHCDFYEQEHEVGDQGRIRPDLLVRLPGGRQVVVDAKVPLEAYLEAIQSSDEATREARLKDHARQVRAHVMMLSRKAYWEAFQPTPEFVVLFLPAETFFSAALEFDPGLIEMGAEQGVILATPTTLITLLKSVFYGWKQESLSRHANEVNELGHDLYKRLVDLSSHLSKIGRSLSSAVDAYNKGIGSFESRVLVTARKFKDLGAASTSLDLDPIEIVEKSARLIQIPEVSITSSEET
ncbi:MAG: DNA recombination protein RmuC [Parachlamydiales bacterium]|nr:DNA recombination protein RmuC [Verrucomicrobiota bacterium]MBX3718998.1 DNA recombination protein RmuC [Candidatus Acheromyda pituitae]